MRLLERNAAGDIRLTKFFTSNVPRYAILSHTWGTEEEEISFQDLMDGIGENKVGYNKIRFCGDQAWRDGLQFFWVDTCCINKPDNTELQEAINSMFRWYRDAAKCYVYLADVSTPSLGADDNSSWELAFRNSRWFTRGWTLQELIAPPSVEFFSKEGVHLGNRRSLEQHIHNTTGIPVGALRGSPLSQFSVSERMAWTEKRNTTRKEDKAYSLLGIFNIHMPLIYGEGENNAFRRLRDEISKASRAERVYDQADDRCLADLRCTDPRHDKMRIEQTKGGLLADSYRWVLDNADFRQWRDDGQSRLLWIKGDPGKGKTMLLCGIINELKSTCNSSLLSFFFCQATDASINNATAVLRGLIYLLVDQQPSFISHVRKKYDAAGNPIFRDVNAWVALSGIFASILNDPSLPHTYLIIDALDECTTGLDQLLRLVVQRSSAYSSVKWVVSSRNWPSIEKDLDAAAQRVRLSLELNEASVSAAVTAYVRFKVDGLAERNEYDNDTRSAIERYLVTNAHGTFLWVALVCQQLANISGWEAEEMLTTFPPGLDTLYRRMMDQIYNSRHAKLFQRILAVVSVVYRPITLDELPALVDTPNRVSSNGKALAEIVGLCGSFLTLRERTISFVHQSAKDFLLKQARDEIFPSGREEVHRTIFSRSLRVMQKTLRRDIYNLGTPGFPIDKVRPPDPDPLAAVQYSCVYWIHHLRGCDPEKNANKDLQGGGSIDIFLREKYLHWLEALSLQKSMSEGVASMLSLEDLFEARKETSLLIDRVRDACRFILYHKWAIENSPLQVYASGLVFSPVGSITRDQFKNEESKWIIRKPTMADNWSACLQTLEGHSDWVNSVAWSPDASRLASASRDKTVKIWDPTTGQCMATLEIGRINSLQFHEYNPDLVHTDLGIFDLKTVGICTAFDSTSTDRSSPAAIGYGLSRNGTWITYKGKNLLWLPPEYRPSSSAISGTAMSIGCSSGRILFFIFTDSNLIQ
ncbi:NACHT domain-containing protein [Chaetomium strumarium]|uniref:NACHT domain-containing protein n=1 Tax=Chaetomium strumarium TaxID=1170767 RepID=A0AAJ0GVZ5_9PEZI|nr:NACHT domain-containing protein [Chaetomium strumarium]